MFLFFNSRWIESSLILAFYLINQLNKCYSGSGPWDLLGLLGLARMVNWLSKVAPFVLDPNLAKPITRLSASWHEKLGLWLFPSMALEEIEFLIWGILRFNIVEAGGFLGGFGCGGSCEVFDIEQGGSSGDCTIPWSDDQMILLSDDDQMIRWLY